MKALILLTLLLGGCLGYRTYEKPGSELYDEAATESGRDQKKDEQQEPK